MKTSRVKWAWSIALMTLAPAMGVGESDMLAQDVLPKPERAFQGTIGERGYSGNSRISGGPPKKKF